MITDTGPAPVIYYSLGYLQAYVVTPTGAIPAAPITDTSLMLGVMQEINIVHNHPYIGSL